MINIKETKYTPKVLLDKEKQFFEIEGESRPEDVFDFYNPIIIELDKTLKLINEDCKADNHLSTDFKANFKFFYFNSSSAKFIADILSILKSYSEKGLNIKIFWYFTEGDEDIKEAGEELSDMISLQFNYVMVKD